MKKLLSILLMGLIVFTFSTQITHAETFNDVGVIVTSHFDGTNNPATTVDSEYGGKISINPSSSSTGDPESSYTFKFWAVNDVLSPDLSEDYEFDIKSDMKLDAYFTKTGMNLAVFVDSNGNVLHHEYVDDVTVVTDPTITIPSKPGMIIADPKWDKVLTTITEDTIYVLQYVNDESNTNNDLAVIASGVTDTLATNAIITGTGSFVFNGTTTLVAPEVSNTIEDTPTLVNFAYWQDTETGQILSYNSEFTFTVLSNRAIEAVYSPSASTAVDMISISDMIQLRDGYYSFLGQFEALDDTTVLEYGIITYNSYTEFNLDTSGISKFQANNSNPETNEFVLSVPTSDIAVRAYLVLRDGEDFIVKYSQVLNCGTVVLLDFEDESKGSYAAATLTIDGNNWLLDDALIALSSATSDKILDTRGVRVQNLGSISSEFTFKGGVESIQFYTARYGTDDAAPISIEYALAATPTTWVTVETILIENTELLLYHVDLDIQQEVYIRILKIAGNERLNFDNIEVHSYPEGDYLDTVNPVIINAVDDSIQSGDSYNPTLNLSVIDNVDTLTGNDITYVVSEPGNESFVFTTFEELSEGTYTLDFSVEDTHHNTGTASITLTVTEAPEANPVVGTELFISEYIEGSSYNKAVEIYNPTDHAITLDTYTLELHKSGATDPDFTLTLSGSILAGETYTVCHNSASDDIKVNCDYINSSLAAFNGDDAVLLFNGTTHIDTVGLIGSTSKWGENKTLTRNSDIHSGNTTYIESEWASFPSNTFEYLGSHTVVEDEPVA